ncbi:hypothetical protein SUDANB140_00828 [Streptomyces sp. enrichment culture]
MVAEALDALWTLLIAGGIWLLITAAVATLTLTVTTIAAYAALYGLWTACKRRWRPERHPRPSWALRGRTARRYARTRPDYDHAA